MTRTHQIIVGQGIMIAGLVALAAGEAVGSHELVVGLLLLIVPLATSSCGALVALIGLARPPGGSGSSPVPRIIAMVALAGIGSGCGIPALATLSQLPDYLTGLNGAFVPPPLLSTLLFPAVGLAVGLVTGSLVAILWWMSKARHRPSAPAAPPAR